MTKYFKVHRYISLFKEQNGVIYYYWDDEVIGQFRWTENNNIYEIKPSEVTYFKSVCDAIKSYSEDHCWYRQHLQKLKKEMLYEELLNE